MTIFYIIFTALVLYVSYRVGRTVGYDTGFDACVEIDRAMAKAKTPAKKVEVKKAPIAPKKVAKKKATKKAK